MPWLVQSAEPEFVSEEHLAVFAGIPALVSNGQLCPAPPAPAPPSAPAHKMVRNGFCPVQF